MVTLETCVSASSASPSRYTLTSGSLLSSWAWGLRDIYLILIWVAVLFVSILIHELGHAYVGRSYGLRPQILLYGMGGLTSWKSGRHLSHRQSILVSLAGPGAGIAFGGLIWAFTSLDAVELTQIGGFVVRQLLWINILWSILNLMPLLPLDGGNVMSSLVHISRGYRDDRLPRQISVVVGGALCALAISYGMTFGAIFAGFLAYSNYAALKGIGYGSQFPGMGR